MRVAAGLSLVVVSFFGLSGVITPQVALAKGAKRISYAETQVPQKIPNSREELVINSTYHSPDTIALRDKCLTQYHSMLLTVVDAAFSKKGLPFTRELKVVRPVTGFIQEDGKGFESFYYQLNISTIDSNAATQRLFALYEINVDVDTPPAEVVAEGQSFDDLGNYISEGARYSVTKRRCVARIPFEKALTFYRASFSNFSFGQDMLDPVLSISFPNDGWDFEARAEQIVSKIQVTDAVTVTQQSVSAPAVPTEKPQPAPERKPKVVDYESLDYMDATAGERNTAERAKRRMKRRYEKALKAVFDESATTACERCMTTVKEALAQHATEILLAKRLHVSNPATSCSSTGRAFENDGGVEKFQCDLRVVVKNAKGNEAELSVPYQVEFETMPIGYLEADSARYGIEAKKYPEPLWEGITRQYVEVQSPWSVEILNAKTGKKVADFSDKEKRPSGLFGDFSRFSDLNCKLNTRAIYDNKSQLIKRLEF